MNPAQPVTRVVISASSLASGESEATLVSFSCVDDDAQGETLSVLWEHELDAQVLEDAGWSGVAEKGS